MKKFFPTRVITYSWAFYDFANTIFSAVVLTFYFPLYLTNLSGKNFSLGLTSTLSMVLAGGVVPWLGALSDRTGKTKTYLILTTFLCVIFTLSLSLFASVFMLIMGFLLACFFYHASLVFYNALLPMAAEPSRQGWVSGLGTGLGYVGVLFAIPIAHAVDLIFGRRFVFLVAGILFLTFSLPLFLWVPERKVAQPSPVLWTLLAGEWKKVFITLRSLGQNRPLLFFFLGNFFAVDAVNTVIFWLIVYLKRVFHPAEASLILIFLGMNFSAFLFGFVAGIFTDRVGSQKTLLAAVGAFFVTLFILALTNRLWIFVAGGLLGGGFGFAGVWTAGRKWLLEWAPPNQVGEYFGLYNLTTKVSVVGSLIFSLLADGLGFHAALLSLVVPSGIGFIFLWRAARNSSLILPSR